MVKSWSEYQAWATRRDKLLLEAAENAWWMALSEVIVIARSTTAFHDRTANLRNSIGHDGPIRASKNPVNFAPPSRSRLVTWSGKVLTATMPIGMEYGIWVDKLKNFTAEAKERAPGIFRQRLSEASALVERRLV